MTDISNGRDARGLFAPGNKLNTAVKGMPSPNPGGFSAADRLARKDLQESLRPHTSQANKALINIMKKPELAESDRVRLQALALFYDRAWGKVPVMEIVSADREFMVRWLRDDEEDEAEREIKMRERSITFREG